ncbi:DUF6497 family protein [Gemmobacter sp.]|uniref:DUF6497 family protein n=1 Tax=Gemmobacter sp. TaxID=1898957 RepID=UPI0025BB793B|nr:DUF6497 family protein [Gemmobacter sp.]
MTGEAISQMQDGTVVLTGGAEALSVPSGQPVTLQDVIRSEDGPVGAALRFRFVAPQIAREGGNVDFETASADMADLCQRFALPRMAELGGAPRQIIISLAAAEVPFGETAPEVTQFFESFRVENGTCIWEMF